MILKVATGVDENILADVDVLPEIGIKRRENTQRLRNGTSRQFCHQRPHLARRMVFAVEPYGHLAGFISHAVHQFVDFGRVKRLALSYVVQERIKCHCLSGFQQYAGDVPPGGCKNRQAGSAAE